jgi:hypothetical protein
MEQRLVGAVLADEPQRERYAAHRQRGGATGNGGNRHRATKPRKRGDVARAGLMLDPARHQEERALVARVRHEVHQRGGDRLARADAEKQHQDAERADGRVREDAFEVCLLRGPVGANDHRRGTDGSDRRRPQRGRAQNRRHPRDEIHPCLDHRRRVQISADRRRRGHRVRQPEMKRHLRGLRKCGKQDQERNGGVERMPHNGLGVHRHRRQTRSAGHVEEQHAGRKQSKAAAARHDQRL